MAATPDCEEIARRLGLPSSAVAQMRKGEIVTKESDATNEKDLSLIIAVLLNSDLRSLEKFAEAERFHEIQDAMLEVGELDPTNPSAGLEAMKLTEDMVKNLMKNPFLSKAEAHRVKDGLKHKKGAQVYKEVLAERAKAYWAKGLEGIEPYEGKGRDPGADLKAATAESLKVIQDPDVRQEIQAIPSKAPHPERHSLTYGIQQGNDMAAPILCHKIRFETDNGLSRHEQSVLRWTGQGFFPDYRRTRACRRWQVLHVLCESYLFVCCRWLWRRGQAQYRTKNHEGKTLGNDEEGAGTQAVLES